MTTLNRHRLEMLERLLQFAIDHPDIVATNPRAATLFAQLPAIVATLRTFSCNQTSGHRTYRSGAHERAAVAARLRKAMRKIHNIAQVLDSAEHPGVRQKFKMPIDSYRALADSGRAFLQHATPIANLFIERGRPITFLAELQTLIESMEAAAQDKHHGRLRQVAGTAGIESEARRGVRIMRELDAIQTDLLEANEPLLAAWKTAAKIESSSKVEGASRGLSSGSTSTTASIAPAIPDTPEDSKDRPAFAPPSADGFPISFARSPARHCYAYPPSISPPTISEWLNCIVARNNDCRQPAAH